MGLEITFAESFKRRGPMKSTPADLLMLNKVSVA